MKNVYVRICSTCKCIGHTADYCKVDTKFMSVVEKCRTNSVCTNCVLKHLDTVLTKEPDIHKATETVLKNVTHRMFGHGCTEYIRLVGQLQKRYDFYSGIL